MDALGGCRATHNGCSSSLASTGSVYRSDTDTVSYDALGQLDVLSTPHVASSVGDLSVAGGAQITLGADLDISGALTVDVDSSATVADGLRLEVCDALIEGSLTGAHGFDLVTCDLIIPGGGIVACTEAMCDLATRSTGHLEVGGALVGGSYDGYAASASLFGFLDTSGKGHTAGAGPGGGAYCNTSNPAGGAGHGGLGQGCTNSSTPAPAYGDPIEPFDFGSGGGTQSYYGAAAGHGGGRSRLQVAGILDNNGLIASEGNGAGSGSLGAGGGSGGSVWLIAAEIQGLGTVTARGGNGGTSGGGGGAGGRIALHSCAPLPDTLNVSVGGGCRASQSGCTDLYAGAGSWYSAFDDRITIDAAGFEAIASPWTGHVVTELEVSGGATVTADDPMELIGELRVDPESRLLGGSGGSLVIAAESAHIEGDLGADSALKLNTTADAAISLGAVLHCDGYLCSVGLTAGGHAVIDGTVTASDLTVVAGSATIYGELDASSLGFEADSGPGAGSYCGTSQTPGSAGHAGAGFPCGTNASGAGQAYGDAIAPETLGSGGGSQLYYNGVGGAGGGRVRLDVDGQLDFLGAISVDGQDAGAASIGGGGGSGGSLWISADTMVGAGTVSARGGRGGWVNGPGGSGGRIALDVSGALPGALVIEAWGGCVASNSGCTTSRAAAGTIYETLTETLTLDNAGAEYSTYTRYPHEVDFKDVVVDRGAAAQLTDSATLQGALWVTEGSSLDGVEGEALSLTAASVQVDGILNFHDLTLAADDVTVTGSVHTDARLAVDSNGSIAVGLGGGATCAGEACDLTFTGGELIDIAGLVMGSTIVMDAEDFLVTGLINAGGRGWAAGTGPGAGAYCNTSQSGGGAGHAGFGHSCSQTTNGAGGSYGSELEPWTMGSGGGHQLYYGGEGGAGGGRIWLNTPNVLHLDGSVGANGAAGTEASLGGGGGAGGAVRLDAGSITGSGVISVRGGDGGANHGGGGSGGRVAVYHGGMSDLIDVDTRGGCRASTSGCSDSHAAAGTLYDAGNDHLVVDAGATAAAVTPLTNETVGNLTITGGAHVRADQTVSIGGHLAIDAGSRLVAADGLDLLELYGTSLTVAGELSSDASLAWGGTGAATIADGGLLACNSPRCGIELVAQSVSVSGVLVAGDLVVQGDSMTVDTGALVDTSGMGFAKDAGPGAGSYCSTSFSGAGAGHGGQGDSCSGAGGAGDSYGDPYAPADFGSGGGSQLYYGGLGGDGGGRIDVSLSGVFTLDGTMSADGTPGGSASLGGGGGSGGSVRVSAGELAGSGTLSASGGDGGTGQGGGGAGGRVAVDYQTSFALPLVLRAQGGCRAASNGCSGDNADHGTIYDAHEDTLTSAGQLH